MNSSKSATLFIVGTMATALCIQSAHSQWSPDPSVNTPICTSHKGYAPAEAIPDGTGGAIFTWFDMRNGNWDIYAQRLDASGKAVWSKNGTPVCTAQDQQFYPAIASDGKGGAIIAWADQGKGQIFAQRLTAKGKTVWKKDGVQVSTAGHSFGVKLTPDGCGGAVLTWVAGKIFAQRIDSSGTRLWSDSGVVACATRGNRGVPSIIEDGTGGSILLWSEQIDRGWSLRTQRLGPNGQARWGTNGMKLVAREVSLTDGGLVSDDSGGAIYVWCDHRSGYSHLYAQRVTASGTTAWSEDGNSVIAPAKLTEGGVRVYVNGEPRIQPKYMQYHPSIAKDGAAGAVIAWVDESRDGRIRAQRINASGNLLWGDRGVTLTNLDESRDESHGSCKIISDDSGNVICAWTIRRAGTTDIYAQRLSVSGKCLWNPEGLPVCTAKNEQADPVVVSDENSGAIIAWKDRRADLPDVDDVDYYAQRVTSEGQLGSANAIPNR